MENGKDTNANEPTLKHYKEIVDFAQKEIKGVREVYKWLIAIVGILFVVGTWFTYKSVKDLKEEWSNTINEVGEKVTSRIDEEFKKDNIRKLVRDKAKERIDVVADKIISKNIGEKIQPTLDDLKDELDNAKKISEFMMTVVKAQSDDRKSFEQLEIWARDKNYSFSKEARDAKEHIRGQYVDTFRLSYPLIDWKKRNIDDPLKLTISQLHNQYDNLSPRYHTDLIIHVWEKIPDTDIPEGDKIQFLIDILKKETSLTALTYAGCNLSKEFERDWNPFVIKHLLSAWEANKYKYNKDTPTAK